MMFHSPLIDSRTFHVTEPIPKESMVLMAQASLTEARDQSILKIAHKIWEDTPLEIDFDDKNQRTLFFNKVYEKYVNGENLKSLEALDPSEKNKLQELVECINELVFSENALNSYGMLFQWMREVVGQEKTDQIIKSQAHPFVKNILTV